MEFGTGRAVSQKRMMRLLNGEELNRFAGTDGASAGLARAEIARRKARREKRAEKALGK